MRWYRLATEQSHADAQSALGLMYANGRGVPEDEAAATALKTRTLTSLYNARPTWLADAPAALDAAVATAYGWPADISDDDALAELLALNLANGR